MILLLIDDLLCENYYFVKPALEQEHAIEFKNAQEGDFFLLRINFYYGRGFSAGERNPTTDSTPNTSLPALILVPSTALQPTRFKNQLPEHLHPPKNGTPSSSFNA